MGNCEKVYLCSRIDAEILHIMDVLTIMVLLLPIQIGGG